MEDKKAAMMRKKSTDKLQKSSSKVRSSTKKSGKELLFEFDNLFRQSDESDEASALNKSQNRWQTRNKKRKKS